MSSDEEMEPENGSEVQLISQMITEVDSTMDPDKIERDIQDFSTFADVSDWKGIVKYFEALVSVTSLVSSYEDWSMRFRIVDYLVACFGTLKDAITDHTLDYIAARTSGAEIPRNPELCQALPMFVLLVQRITVQLQLYVSKRQRDAAAEKTGRKGKRVAAGDLDEDAQGWLNVQRNRLINCLCEILQLEVEIDQKQYKNCAEYVWKPDAIDPDFLKTFADTVFGVLEDPECLRVSTQTWLQKVFQIVKILSIDYNLADEMAKRLLEKSMSLEYLRESAATTYPFIEPIVAIGYQPGQLRSSKNLRSLLDTITIGACAITKCNFNSLKPLSLLIQSLGEHVPDILLKNNYSILQLLSHDSAIMRSAGLTVLFDILKSEFLTDAICKQFENRKKQRMLLFHKLMGHLHDSHAQTRAKTVGLFTKLMEGGSIIPIEIQSNGLISLMANRLNDKSVMVRKNAVTFLTTFLTYNAFGHDFNYSIVIDKLRALLREKKLMKNPENSIVEEVAAQFASKDMALKIEIREQIDKYVNGQAFGDEEIDGHRLIDKYEQCVERVLDRPQVSVVILMHIYASKNWLPLLDESQTIEEQKSTMQTWLYNKINDDYINNEIRKHNLNDEEMVLEEQRVEDYRAKQLEIKLAIDMCKNKLCVEEELSKCVQYSLRSVIMGELSEMKESIKFLAKCKQFNIRGAENAIRSMCSLVWRNSLEIRKELLEAATDMFISKYSNLNEKERIREESTVTNLMNAMKDINESDRCSVEEVIYLLAQKDLFTPGVIQKLWAIASGINRDTVVRIDALRILYAITRSENGVVESRQRLRTLQRMLSLETPLAFEALRVVSVLHTPTSNSAPDVNTPIFQIPNDDSFFRSLEQLFIYEMLRDSDDQNWFGICQVTITIILNIAKDVNELLPKFASVFLYRARRASEFYLFYKKAAENQRNSSETRKKCAEQRRDYWAKLWCRIIERLVAFIGEIAVRINGFIQLNIPKIHANYEAKMRFAHKNESNIPEEPARFLDEIENTIVKRRLIFDYTLEASQGESDNFMHSLTQLFAERRVLKPQKLLGRLLPIVVYAVRAENIPERIRDAASFAFGKFMTLSTIHAEFAAPTFFTLMSKTPYPLVRSNLLVACSDLAFSQPNLFELYSKGLYQMSRDIEPATRESAILVLSHLMSNDMIQIRSLIIDPVRCIGDDNPAVAKIATSFFADLNRRGESIHQYLPEFMFDLSSPTERLPFANYERIFEFLIGLVREKSRTLADTALERIFYKFATSETKSHPDAPKYLAFIVSKFTLTDNAFQHFKQSKTNWSKFLNHKIVVTAIRELLTTFAKSTKSDELKKEADELVAKIDRVQIEGMTSDMLTTSVTPKRNAKGRKAAAASTAKTRKRKPSPVFSDDDEDYE